MPTIARLIVYTGTQAALEQCMGRSLNDGVKQAGQDLEIRVLTLPPAFMALLGAAEKALDALPDTSVLTRGADTEKEIR